MRRLALLVASAVVLVAVNLAAYRLERGFKVGRTVHLPLSVTTERALVGGDHAVVRWVVPRGVASVVRNDPERRTGLVVVRLDARGVGSVERVHRPGDRLGASEHLLRYEMRDDRIAFGSESLFLEEGAARYHRSAVFGELSVSPDGEAVLVALCDRQLARLGPLRAAEPEATP